MASSASRPRKPRAWPRVVPVVVALALSACGGRNKGGDGDTSGGGGAYLPPDIERVPTTPAPTALAEIVAAAPRASVRPTGPGGGSLVGSDTTLDGGAASAEPIDYAPPPVASGPRLTAGRIEIRPGLSNPEVERVSREQIYWPLVQECRGPDGSILPPDAVTLEFVIRPDGTVDPGSVAVTSDNPAFRAAAECMQRKFVALPLRPPAASLGRKTVVQATLPSVD